LFGFEWGHNDLLGSGSGSVFQALKLLAWFEADGFSRGYADFFASARVAANASFAWFHAEDAKLAEFDALAAAEGILERFEDGLDSLFRFGAADVGFGDHRIYDVELNHTILQEIRGPMLEAAARVVKTWRLIYTLTF
jgi:hypothetical protein